MHVKSASLLALSGIGFSLCAGLPASSTTASARSASSGTAQSTQSTDFVVSAIGLQAKLRELPGYAGFWVESQDSKPIVHIQYAGDHRSLYEAAAADYKYNADVRYESVDWTDKDLASTLEQIVGRADGRDGTSGRTYDVYVDTTQDRVVISGPQPPSLSELVPDLTRHGADVVIRPGGAQSEPDACTRTACDPEMMAGLDTGSCTTAFSATRNGEPGVLTAGHCPDSLSHDGQSLGPVVVQQLSGDVDAQWHDTGTDWTTEPDIWVGIPEETTRHVESSGNDEYVGMPICMSGAVSNYVCGNVTSLNFAPSYVPNSHGFREATYVRSSGDSGAPVFAASRAYGIHSGRASDGSAIYSPIVSIQLELGVALSK